MSCLIVIFIYVLLKGIHSFAQELSADLICFTGMVNAYNFIYSNEEDDNNIYNIQAIVTYFFDSSLWTTIISYMSYQSLVNQNYILNNKKKLRLIFYRITIIIPFIFSIVPYFLDGYQKPDNYNKCEIILIDENDDKKKQGLILCSMYYLFTWSVIFYNIYCITSLILTIRKSRIDKAQRNKYTIRLIWFSIMQIINYVPSTINISIK